MNNSKIDSREINLLQQYPLNEYIEKLTEQPLKKMGSNYMCSCVFPDHKDKSPSFAVYYKSEEDGWRYKCHGCGKFGNIINFTREYKGLGFIDAIKFISNVTGIKVNIAPPNKYHEDYKNTMTNHAIRYMRNLYTKDGEVALNYLRRRGISDDTIKLYGIGYVPKDEYKNRSDKGWISNRISYPIIENTYNFNNARVIGMGYRTLEDILDNKKVNYKYVNDKNSEGNCQGVFVKGDNFFGFNQSYTSIRQVNCAIIVEGYMDVLALSQSGIANVLGNMTASMTKTMINNLKKLCNNVIMFLDNDDTGVKFTKTLIPELLREGLNVKVFVSPKGKDAADLCLELGFDNEKVSELINTKSIDAINHMINLGTQRYVDIAIAERERAINELEPLLKSLGSRKELLYRDILLKRLDMC